MLAADRLTRIWLLARAISRDGGSTATAASAVAVGFVNGAISKLPWLSVCVVVGTGAFNSKINVEALL